MRGLLNPCTIDENCVFCFLSIQILPGMLMLYASGTLYSNASISPLSSLQIPTNRKAKLDAHAQAKLQAKIRRYGRMETPFRSLFLIEKPSFAKTGSGRT